MKWLPIVLPFTIAVAAIAAALAFGGPAPIQPLASINEPFAKVDFSAVPPNSHYTARDGTRLAWLHYPATGNTADLAPRRIVLVHGSSARGRSMHPMAQALAAAGFDVAALDIRGHGDSGPRGHIAYIGQLEDDIEDFMKAQAWPGPSTLLGFSSGGGFVLRFAADHRASLFDRYLLLSPFLHQSSPTKRPGNDDWVSIGLPRIIALSVLNPIGITVFNHLSTLRFGLNADVRDQLTEQYDHALATNFRPHSDFAQDIRQIRQPLRILAGQDDELFDASRFAAVFQAAGHAVPVTTVDGINHMGLTLDRRALQAVAAAANLE
ncbi:alpha/beta hydrolase [Hydrogenophaga crassostreae]|uniref:Alpha/beta hydrolase n=1 Tax=Hydrogenophaga crassostreae TaxID=1763535 RepID=A0A167IUS6_9BURK|nr:alpha/beta hydrolase [Hydrogenophaga crassostreae]AOW14355.1 alpha/beta hydrolase [Hydrogenophaga crassostreae]OAD43621.1 alpha/beta hydrolase [Hydrogenophaga crassostreae]